MLHAEALLGVRRILVSRPRLQKFVCRQNPSQKAHTAAHRAGRETANE